MRIQMTRVAINGAAGRMGVVLLKAAHEAENVELAAAVVRPNSDKFGVSVKKLADIDNNLKTVGNLEGILDQFDVLIDFTNPKLTLSTLQACQDNGKKIVIGTTGFNDDELALIRSASESISILLAPNTSLGVNLVLGLLEKAAAVLGDDADIEIIEMHHRNKIDAPSGTALKMGEVIADTLGRELATCAVYGREGETGSRDKKTIGFATLRGGDVVGEHTVIFACEGERIEITHKASHRMTFARGAVRAAQWLMKKDKGLFTMQDVLEID